MAVPGANGDDEDGDGNEEDDRDFSKLPQLNVQHEDEFSGGREISAGEEYSGECFVEGNPFAGQDGDEQDGDDAFGVVGSLGEWGDMLAVDIEGADAGSPQKIPGPGPALGVSPF